MLRSRLRDCLAASMKAKDKPAVSTLRLILAALKDRDIAARSKGDLSGVDDSAILDLLQSMIRQRQDSIAMYQTAGRTDLAEQEAKEIEIIKQFLPEQLDADEMAAAVDSVIAEIEAKSLKDMGRTMAELKERYAGQMDFAKASAIVKEKLA